ncbi:septum site-determining protein MinC [Reinekea marina]|uniref:Probable septum site-determining protein MinC n=1 Tax=Reinekea marina TaxID=1310421 RepID=A0ABV7WMP2_9GAMM|nr:septum site-determining protein MinC [Reinekea marina]MDN3648459.1 septum site-determining protein MinC [Reinekea marina]
MNQIAESPAQPLKLRSRLVTSHQIKVPAQSIDALAEQLQKTLAQAPALFKWAPTVLDISDCDSDYSVDNLNQCFDMCRKNHLVPFALTSNHSAHQKLAKEIGCAWVEPKASKKAQRIQEAQPRIQQTKVVSTPIRSGQQVYAKNAHLLITSQVSAGAEVIADGNVTILGALRGRAIAGAQGDIFSEIICQQMYAELIAIAGNYLVQEDFPAGEGGARCYLEEQSLKFDFL